MELQAACKRNFTRLMIALAITVASGTVYAILTRPARDPDQLWDSIQQDLKAGRLDSVEAPINRLLQLRPPTEDQRLVLGQIAMARGRDAEAIDHLRRVSDAHPQAARARTWEGTIELRKKRARRAEEALLHAARLAPDDPAPRRELILLYCMQRRRRDLSEQFAALSRLTPLDLDQMLLWSSSLAASWDPSETIPILEGFVNADREDLISRLTLAEALRRFRRVAEVDEVLRYLPSADPDVRAIRARIAADRGDEVEAERLTRDGPDEHFALSRIRARLALSRRDLPTACKHLRTALALDPHNRGVLFQLGDTLTRLGKTEEGRKYISAAKDHDTLFELLEQLEVPKQRSDFHLLTEVAHASHKVGLVAEARAWYLLALQLDPTSSEIQKQIYRLDHEQVGALAQTPALQVTRDPREPGAPTAPVQ